MRCRISKILIGCCLSLFFSLFIKNSTFAVVNSDQIMKKWVFTQHYQCIINNPINGVVDFDDKADDIVVKNIFKAKSVKVLLPSYQYGHSVSGKEPSVNCEQLFWSGSGKIGNTVVDYAGIGKNATYSDSAKDANLIMGYLGYKGIGTGETLIKLRVTRLLCHDAGVGAKKYELPSKGFRGLPENIVDCNDQNSSYTEQEYDSVGLVAKKKNGKYVYDINGDNSTSSLGFEFQDNKTRAKLYSDCRFTIFGGTCSTPNGALQQVVIDLDSEDVQKTVKNLNDVKEVVRDWYRTYYFYDDHNNLQYVEERYIINPSTSVATSSSINSKFQFPNTPNEIYTKSNESITAISGKGITGQNFDDSERYTLYVAYLDKLLPKDAQYRMTCDKVPEGTGLTLIEVYLNGSNGYGNKCYINFGNITYKQLKKKKLGKLATQLSKKGSNIPYITQIEAYQVVEWLRTKHNVKNVVAIGESSEVDEMDSGGSAEETCESAGGAGSLGWLVCPIMRWLSDATEKAYVSFVEPSLQVNPQLFTGEGEGVYKAWEIFRNFANFIFIILLLAVIFSQLTGVGIDNYGIKKILPKLIVAAVLINLSYIICLALTDVSNILGNGLRLLFDNLISGVPAGISSGGSSGSDGLVVGVVIGAMLLGLGVVVWKNPAFLLTLLVGLLGLAVSIFFLFVLLSMRQAVLIVLIAASPLAFACYMLPNTKKVFDKWKSFFQGLLIVYPVAGLLIGAGNFVSKLLLNSSYAGSGFVQLFTAMAVGIVPIFFIPTVIKGSFSAMGKVGAMLSGLGSTARGKATSGIRNSNIYKGAQQSGLERSIRKKAGFDPKTGGLTRAGKMRARFAQSGLGRMVGADRRQNAYLASAKKTSAEKEQSVADFNAIMASEEFAKGNGTKKDIFERQFKEAGGDLRKMNAAIKAAKQNGVKGKDIAETLRNVENNGGFGFKSDESRANFLNTLASEHGDVLGTDFELKDWVIKGGTSALGARGSHLRSVDRNDLKPEDIATQSGNSLASMIQNKFISPGMASQVLESNPNLSEDKKIMLGALADGKLKGGEGWTYDDLKSDVEKIQNGDFDELKALDVPDDEKEVEEVLTARMKAWTAPRPQRVETVNGSAAAAGPSLSPSLDAGSGAGAAAVNDSEIQIDHSGGQGNTDWTAERAAYERKLAEQSNIQIDHSGGQGNTDWTAERAAYERKLAEQSNIQAARTRINRSDSEQQKMHDEWRRQQGLPEN